jgi:DNA ligase-1
MSFKPLLASPANLDDIDYDNTWMSPKLDGIRAMVINGVVVSRNLKPIRNKHVQRMFGGSALEGHDGELIVGEATAKDCYLVTNSGVMSADGEPNVSFHVFDRIDMPGVEYFKRYEALNAGVSVIEEGGSSWIAGIVKVPQRPVIDATHLLGTERKYLAEGYEGVMLRAFMGPRSFYKYGRSTAKEGTLLKLKRFEDAEAPVTGFEEEMANTNEATKDALGHTERSAHQAGLVGKGRLGALVCEHPDTGIEFKIGTGFDAATRQKLWDERDKLKGKIAKFKHFVIGAKEAPRFPVFLGFRDPIDA